MKTTKRPFGLMIATALLACSAAQAETVDLPINDSNVFPESVTSTPDGGVIIGSLVRPVIYRAAPGAKTAEPWIHLTGDQTGSTSGVLADVASNTLWACVMAHPANTPRPPAMNLRHTSIRSFDLTTGAFKARYELPGANNVCNDIAVAPDHTLYATDTLGSSIARLKPGAAAMEAWLTDKQLAGVDGIAFVGANLYVNTVGTGKIYRVPVQADGSAGALVEVKLSQPLMGPDGMRVLGARMFVAENRAGRISELRFDGDNATVTMIEDGYANTTTSVSASGGLLWFAESKQNFWRAPDEGKDPGTFLVHKMALPK